MYAVIETGCVVLSDVSGVLAIYSCDGPKEVSARTTFWPVRKGNGLGNRPEGSVIRGDSKRSSDTSRSSASVQRRVSWVFTSRLFQMGSHHARRETYHHR
jgi:hypothetical protein